MDPVSKVEYTGIIRKLHNMQWLKSSSPSGHSKGKVQGDTLKNASESIKNIESGDMASASGTTSTENTVDKDAEVVENMWTKNKNAADTLFPNVQSLVIQKLNEEEMLSLALSESIVTAQLEGIKFAEIKEEENKSQQRRCSVSNSASDEDSIWDRSNRQSVSDDNLNAIELKIENKQSNSCKGISSSEEVALKQDEELPNPIEISTLRALNADSPDDQYSVASMVMDECKQNTMEQKSTCIKLNESAEKKDEIITTDWKKQFIGDKNDFVEEGSKLYATDKRESSNLKESGSCTTTNSSSLTAEDNHLLKMGELSRVHEDNSELRAKNRPSPAEDKYSANVQKRESSRNTEQGVSDRPRKDVGSLNTRTGVTRIVNRRRGTSNYRKYDTNYIAPSNEKRHFQVTTDGGRTETTAPKIVSSVNIKQTTLRNTEAESTPPKFTQSKDKAEIDRSPDPSDKRFFDNNNNKANKTIGCLRKHEALVTSSGFQANTNKHLGRGENLATQYTYPDVRDNDRKDPNTTWDSAQNLMMTRPILARNIQCNDSSSPSEPSLRENVHDGNQIAMFSPPELSYDAHNNNRHPILPTPALSQGMYSSEQAALMPVAGFYNHQAFPPLQQWSSHMSSLQHQNLEGMCGNYVSPQHFSCPTFQSIDPRFGGLESHRQGHSFTVSCGQAVHVINPMYGSCYTIPASMQEHFFRNSQSVSGNLDSFSYNVDTRNDVRLRESQDTRISSDARVNRYQNNYAPEQKCHFYNPEGYGGVPYTDMSRRPNQLNPGSHPAIRPNNRYCNEAIGFPGRLNSQNKADVGQVPNVAAGDTFDTGFPRPRAGIGRGRLRPRES